jgi:hypothetical protein
MGNGRSFCDGPASGEDRGGTGLVIMVVSPPDMLFGMPCSRQCQAIDVSTEGEDRGTRGK